MELFQWFKALKDQFKCKQNTPLIHSILIIHTEAYAGSSYKVTPGVKLQSYFHVTLRD